MQVLDDIAEFLEKRNTSEPYIININSTVMPGTFQNELIPYMEKKDLNMMSTLLFYIIHIS